MSHGPHLREMSIYHFFHLHATKAAAVGARKGDEKSRLAPTAVSFFPPPSCHPISQPDLSRLSAKSTRHAATVLTAALKSSS